MAAIGCRLGQSNAKSFIIIKPCFLATLSFGALAFAVVSDDDGTSKSADICQCQGPKPVSSTADYDDFQLSNYAPTLPIYMFRPNPHLEIAFDVRTRNPVYVLEKLPVPPVKNDEQQPSSLSVVDRRRRRRPNFYEETSLPEMFRSRNGHYRHSGYDRGHLAPAADFMTNYDLLHDTFTLCNVSPQDPSLNRALWAQLELWTRQVAQREWQQHRKKTLVVTGPLWLPSHYHPAPTTTTTVTTSNGATANSSDVAPHFEYRYPAVGQPPSLLAVPTHFFKIIVVIKEEGIGTTTIDKFACFVVPNQKLVDDTATSGRLEHYLVRWSDIEAVVGMRFFPQLMLQQPSMIDLADALTDGVGELGSKTAEGKKIGNQLLLLTDGSSSRPNKALAAKKGPAPLEHLCSRGSCR